MTFRPIGSPDSVYQVSSTFLPVKIQSEVWKASESLICASAAF